MHVYETSWSCIFVHAFLCDRYQYDPQPKRYQLPSNLFEWLLSSIWNIDSICFFSSYANDQDVFLSGDFTNANVFFSFKSTSIQSFFYNNIYIFDDINQTYKFIFSMWMLTCSKATNSIFFCVYNHSTFFRPVITE